jgi:hypothetical protein
MRHFEVPMFVQGAITGALQTAVATYTQCAEMVRPTPGGERIAQQLAQQAADAQRLADVFELIQECTVSVDVDFADDVSRLLREVQRS